MAGARRCGRVPLSAARAAGVFNWTRGTRAQSHPNNLSPPAVCVSELLAPHLGQHSGFTTGALSSMARRRAGKNSRRIHQSFSAFPVGSIAEQHQPAVNCL